MVLKFFETGKPNTLSSRLGPHIGMSSIGMSVAQLLSHDSTSAQDIIHFRSNNGINLLEFLIYSSSTVIMFGILH